ncbi:MAG: hypothetical protein JWR24_44 [Actinoallomurus sp.]|nr:hypothetical protein [Actinoallomurus sp.]
MGRGSGSALWPARNHDQFRETDGRGGSVPAAVDVLDVEADMLKGCVEGWFVPEAESSGFSSSHAAWKPKLSRAVNRQGSGSATGYLRVLSGRPSLL